MTDPNLTRPTRSHSTRSSSLPRPTRPVIVAAAAIVALMASYLALFARPDSGPGMGTAIGALVLYLLLEIALQSAAAYRRRGSTSSPRQERIEAQGRRAGYPVLVFGILLVVGAGFLGTASIALAGLGLLGLAFATAARLEAERSFARADLATGGTA